MEFRILGPLEVRNGSGVIELRGTKQRWLLAFLLLHANEPIKTERLALALWGDDAPADAGKAVHVHVSRLRKTLGDGQLLTTTPAGYRLRVQPGELDAERFAQQVRDGRRALEAGHPEEASDLLRGALGLWRGRPLDDLAHEPLAAAEIDRLEEQRLAALEAQVDADLAAGRHAEVVDELQELAARHPTRERLAGQLMLALYRCGRQTDALEAYRSARRLLLAEVGIEPGPDLRRLNEAILRQDASLEAPPPIAVLPAELDPDTAPALVGREGELACLREHWTRARTGVGAVVALMGPPGSGKRRLAAELAGELHRGGATVLAALRREPAADCATALHRALASPSPTLLVTAVGEEAPPSAMGAALDRLLAEVHTRPLLVIMCGDQRGPLAGLPSDARIVLEPLDERAVRAIALAYVPRSTADRMPVAELLAVSKGLPALAHEAARSWAQEEAEKRVRVAAGRTAAGRAQLRSVEADLAGGIADLQTTRDLGTRVPDRTTVVCPFKGLAPFDTADAAYFFGREGLVARLVARLVGAPLLGVVGPSGSGKSSVVRAGLVPALAAGVLPGSEGWCIRLMRPGQHPVAELGRVAARDGDQRLLLAIDQFEETFTACEDPGERWAFVEQLTRAATDGDGPCSIVLTLRADDYGRCAQFPELSTLLAANHVLVPPMRRAELRRAVERPAELAGMRVETAVTDAIVAEVEHEPGGLPMMSTALLELWEHRTGWLLQSSTYDRLGGVRGAVARVAEHAFSQLDATEQAAARGVLLRLAHIDDEGAVERRRIPLADLEPAENPEVGRTVRMLADRRLLTVSAGAVELAHEALLREWPRLRDWIAEDRRGIRIQRSLNAAARDWQDLGRDEGALYRGARLAEALEWRAASRPPLLRLEQEFLISSERRRVAEQRGRRRRVRLAFALLTMTLVVIGGVAAVAIDRAREAGHQRDIARSRELANSSTEALAVDPELSLDLARRAVATSDTAQADRALRQAVLAFRGLAVIPVSRDRVESTDVSPDGRRIVTASGDGVVRIWDVEDRRMIASARVHGKSALRARFSPDGRRVASAGADGVVAITDAATGRHRVILRVPGAAALALAFSPDGNDVVAGFTDGTVRMAAADGGGARTLWTHAGVVLGVAISPDGRRVASAGTDRTVRISTIGGGDPLTVEAGRAPVGAVDFSPDGRRLAGGDGRGFIRIWDPDTGVEDRRVRAGERAVYTVRYAPDGRRVVAAGEDGGVYVVDTFGTAVTAVLRGHAGHVLDATFLPTGDRVVSSGRDGTVRLWEAGTDRAMRAPTTGADASPDGKLVLSGGTDGAVRIWDAASGRLETTLRGHADESVARFAPTGRTVVSASLDGSVRVWDVPSGAEQPVWRLGGEATPLAAAMDRRGRIAVAASDGRVLIRTPPDRTTRVLRGHHGEVLDVSFSPDGTHLASAGNDHTVRIWDLTRPDSARVLRGNGGAVNSTRFSRDGRRVVSAGVDGTVRVWSAAGTPIAVLRGHDGEVTSAAFDPRGNRIVSSGLDGTVRVWDARGGDPLVTLHEHSGGAWSAQFTHGGVQVLSAGGDDRIWQSTCVVCGTPDEVLALARERHRRPLTANERSRFLPDG